MCALLEATVLCSASNSFLASALLWFTGPSSWQETKKAAEEKAALMATAKKDNLLRRRYIFVEFPFVTSRWFSHL